MVINYTYLELYLKDLNANVSLSEFEKHFKRPHQTIKSHLSILIKKKILLEDKRDRFLFYKLNHENPLTKEFISICEKERLIKFIENPLFKRLYDECSMFFQDSKFLIFGSSIKSKDFQDIDILAISNNPEIKKTLLKFEQTYSKKIHLIQCKESEISKALILEIRKNHVILNKHDEFMKVIYFEHNLVQAKWYEANRTK